MPPKVVFHTLGCKSNQYETDRLMDQAAQFGYGVLEKGEGELRLPQDDVHAYVVNTCCVTKLAERKSRQALRRAQRQFPKAKVLATGCYASLAKDHLEGIVEEGGVLSFSDQDRLKDFLPTASLACQSQSEGDPAPSLPARVRANLLVQNGCDLHCTYCIIPTTRGKGRSRPGREIVQEARMLAARGTKELILTGINIGYYGRGQKERVRLKDLFAALVEIPGIHRIRLSSIEPNTMTDGLLDTLAACDKLCHHFHIPLQSGDNEILARMGRHYTRERFLNLLGRLRARMPQASINTDIMIGFPGETEKHFQNTVRLAQEAQFSRMHLFRFSAHEGTPAHGLRGEVPPGVMRARLEQLSRIREEGMFAYAQTYLGTVQPILVEQYHAQEKMIEGLTEQYLRVRSFGSAAHVGSVVPVRLEGFLDVETLWGSLV